MYTYVCIYIYVCGYYTYIDIQYTYPYIYVYIYTYIYICVYIHTYVYTYIFMYLDMHVARTRHQNYLKPPSGRHCPSPQSCGRWPSTPPDTCSRSLHRCRWRGHTIPGLAITNVLCILIYKVSGCTCVYLSIYIYTYIHICVGLELFSFFLQISSNYKQKNVHGHKCVRIIPGWDMKKMWNHELHLTSWTRFIGMVRIPDV